MKHIKHINEAVREDYDTTAIRNLLKKIFEKSDSIKALNFNSLGWHSPYSHIYGGGKLATGDYCQVLLTASCMKKRKFTDNPTLPLEEIQEMYPKITKAMETLEKSGWITRLSYEASGSAISIVYFREDKNYGK